MSRERDLEIALQELFEVGCEVYYGYQKYDPYQSWTKLFNDALLKAKNVLEKK